MQELVQKIKMLQISKGLIDAQFAKTLGISRSYWSQVQAGKRNPGTKFIKRLSLTYPEAGELIIKIWTTSQREERKTDRRKTMVYTSSVNTEKCPTCGHNWKIIEGMLATGKESYFYYAALTLIKQCNVCYDRYKDYLPHNQS